MMNDLILRPFNPDDFTSVIHIYKEGVSTGVATFETEIPNWDTWNNKYLQSCRIVAEIKNKIVGIGTLSQISKRDVYKGVAEVSVYASKEYRGKHIGESILNDAAIFFDFNSPIITNEVVTTFDFWLATDEVDQFIDLQLYPNPTKGDIILSFSLEESGATTIEVLDIYGKTVQQLMQNESLYAGDYQLSLVEKSLLPGTYFVKMNSGNKTAIEKLVVIQ